jgi:hypothetical protein
MINPNDPLARRHDRFMWLFPGIACAELVMFLLLSDLLYFLLLQPAQEASWIVSFFGSGAVKVSIGMSSALIMFIAGRFAIDRLILNPEPPDA